MKNQDGCKTSSEAGAAAGKYSAIKSRFLFTGAASALALSLAVSAAAQTVPAECAVTPNPLASGSTILCVSSTPIGPIETDVDDLTIVIGDAATPTTIENPAGNAIHATTLDNGGITVQSSAGTVTGQVYGIYTRAFNQSAITVTSADVTGTSNSGIAARAYGGGITVDSSAGTATGGIDGIVARDYGAGAITVTAADVVGGNGDGIDARSYGGGTTVDSSAGTVLGGVTGIYARDLGAGAISLTVDDVAGGTNGIRTSATDGTTTITLGSTADVTGITGAGILASSTGGMAHITVQGMSGNVIGGTDGMDIDTVGGDILVDNLDSVTGQAGDGLDLYTGAGGGNITVNAVDTIMGTDGNGILAFAGTGDISIQGSGLVGGITGTGRSRITIGGTQFTNGHGIFARTDGSINIGGMSAIGDVTSEEYTGISAVSTAGGGVTVDSSAGTVTGDNDGIVARDFGAGAISVTTADVTGTNFFGIFARSDGGGITVDSTAGMVFGGERGIIAGDFGGGFVNVTTADVVGGTDDGIDASTDGGGVTVDSSAGTVTGDNDGIVARNFGAGAISLTVDDVTGGANGIRTSATDGTTTITLGSTADVTGITGAGILASSSGAMANITVQGMSGNVIGGTDGMDIDTAGADILVDNLDSVTGQAGDGLDLNTGTGGGNITVNAVDTIMGTGGNGILAFAGTGDISIQGSGLVGGITGTGRSLITIGGAQVENGHGIFARTDGSINIGGMSAIGDVTSEERTGIYAVSTAGGGVTVDSSAGTVTGDSTGIFARDFGTGAVTVTIADVTGTNFFGIFARSAGGGITVDSTAGMVVGGERGILANDFSGGLVNITTADVVGGTGEGIDATTRGGGVTIDSSAGTVTGDNNGIVARDFGAGAISVTTADVAGTNGTGISARSTGGGITVDSSAGTVIGRGGIYALDTGAGAVTVTTADVTGTNFFGIFARSDGGGITVDSTAGMVVGGERGIIAGDFSGGFVNVTTADVVGVTDDGIDASTAGGGITIDSSAGTVTGDNDGIVARDFGAGAISLTVDDVTGGTNGIRTSATDGTTTITLGSTADVAGITGAGILASSSGAMADITVQGMSGNVIGGTDGMDIDTVGGDILVDNLDSVTGQVGDGLNLYTGAGGGSITVNAVDTILGTGGIGILANAGTGDISIQGSGLVGGITGTGSGDIIIGGSTFANGSGILAVTDGAINIGGATAIGDVTSDNASGIFAQTTGSAGGIKIDSSAGNISGGIDGISAMNTGDGALSVTASSVTGNNGIGVKAFNGTPSSGFRGTPGYQAPIAAGTDLTITTTGLVSAATTGIDARNYGSGSLSISTNAVTAAGTGIFESGILARNLGTELSIVSSGPIVGGSYGINSLNNGSGATNIEVTSVSATGTYGRAIQAYNYSNANGLSITATGLVSGGVVTRNGGRGDLAVNVVDVDSAGTTIFAYGGVQSNNLTVTSTGIVSGERQGIVATNFGSGLLAINANDVSTTDGSYGEGILAGAHGTGLSINATGDVVGSRRGIEADNFGTGTLSIVANNVTAVNGTGIDAENRSFGVPIADDLSIVTTGDVIGAFQGVSARNEGLGATSLLVNNVSATGNYGSAINVFGSGTDLAIEAGGSVDAGGEGINAYSRGSGSISISTKDVTSTNGPAIRATNGNAYLGGGTDVVIDSSTGRIIGGTNGIDVTNNGSGTTVINTGAVTGTNGVGISVVNRGTTTGVTITTADDVTGGITGIYADAGTGDLLLDIGGDVTGGTNGVVTVTQDGTDLTVAVGQTISGGTTGIATMAQGGSATSNDVLNILGTVSGAIMTFEGDDIVTVGEEGTVNGAIMLGTGTDTLNLSGVMTGIIRGGDDDDILNFNAAPSLINNSGDAADAIAEFETYNFNVGGFMLGGVHSGLTNVNFNAGEAMLMGTLSSIQSNIAPGARLQAADGAVLVGNLANAGSLDINTGGVGTFAIDGNFAQTTAGELTLDIQGATNSDLITVTGNVALSGTLNLVQTDLFADTITLIDGAAGVTGSFDTINGLQNGLLITQSIVTDLATSNVNLVAGRADATLLDALTPNQAAVANVLTTQFSAGSLTSDLRDLVVGLGLTPNAATLSALLDELTPEIVNAGIDGVRLTQDRFRKTLMSQYQHDDRASGEVAALGTFALAAATGAKAPASEPQIWGAVNYNYHRNDTTVNNKGYRADGFELTAGVSGVTVGAWQVGFAAGYSDFDTNDLRGTRDRSASELFRFGIHGNSAFDAGALGINGHVDIALDYGYGNNDITMFTAGALTALGTAQNGTADTETYGMSFRLNLDGSGDRQWPIRPFVSIAYDHFSQDAVALTGGGVTDLAIDKVDMDRIAFGYGIRGDHTWGQTALRVGLAGYHYEGDTQTAVTSRFLATGVNGVAFTTVGFDIRDQFQLDAGLSQSLGDGWSLSVDGYTEFGDIESYGGLIKIMKKF